MVRWLGWALLCGVFLAGAALISLQLLKMMSTPNGLARAAFRGDTTTIRSLAHSGVNLNGASTSGFTALDWAAREGRIASIDALLDAGADPDILDDGPNGWTALHHAIHRDQTAALEDLLDRGADFEQASRYGETPLMLAAEEGQPRLVQLLLAAGADPRVTNGDRSLLSYALRGGNAACVRAVRKAAPEIRVGSNIVDRLAQFTLRLRGHRAMLRALASNPPALSSKALGGVAQ